MSKKHRAIYYSVCGALIALSLTGIAYSSYVLTYSSQNAGVDVTASPVYEDDGMIHGGNQSLSVRQSLRFTEYGFVGANDATSYDQEGILQLNVPINLAKTKRSDDKDSDGNYTYTFDIILSHSVTYTGSGVYGDVTSTSQAPDLVQYVTQVAIYDSSTSTTTPLSSYDLTSSNPTLSLEKGDHVYSAKVEDATITSSLTTGTLTNIYFEFTFKTSDTYTSSADFNTYIYEPYEKYITNNTENNYTYSYNFTLNWKKDS